MPAVILIGGSAGEAPLGLRRDNLHGGQQIPQRFGHFLRGVIGAVLAQDPELCHVLDVQVLVHGKVPATGVPADSVES